MIEFPTNSSAWARAITWLVDYDKNGGNITSIIIAKKNEQNVLK